MHHSRELPVALKFIMMLVFSRCTVMFNNYSTLYMAHSKPLACTVMFNNYRTLYMAHSKPLACFHVVEL